MSEQSPMGSRARPSWFSVMNLAAGIQVVVVLMGVVIWATSHADKADSVAAAAISVNARLDRLFEKVDMIAENLPVLREKVSNLEQQVTDGRGQYSSLDVRLRAIENNTAAVHEEATTALKRTR